MKYEKLLSVDPIGAFDKIKDNYLRYFRTMYKFRDISPLKELNEDLYGSYDEEGRLIELGTIHKDGNLYKDAFCEILPEYQSAQDELEVLIKNEPGIDWPKEFGSFISKGLMRPDPGKKFIPYQHQYDMLKLAYGQKKNVVITSGTGSGKTESFMLPLLASLLKEAEQWNEQKNYDEKWYSRTNDEGDYDQAYQRKGEDSSHTPALRALVLYPMNALVNDQMERLRITLDNDDIRNFLDTEFKKNRLFFGRYNSATLGNKDIESGAQGTCASELHELVTRSRQISEKIENNNLDKGAEFVAPRFPSNSNANQVGAEMLTRWDIQKFPPDILITNVSMLAVALMRSYEDPIFNQTKDYYEKNPEANFHLIVDELHLHRGTAGSEVACLLRMFLERIGIPPTIEAHGKRIANPRLRILASSASLGSDTNTQKFLEEFFGVYNEDKTPAFEVIGGHADRTFSDKGLKIDYNDFRAFAPSNQQGSSCIDDDALRAQTIESLISKYKCDTLEEFLSKHHEQMFHDIKKATKIKDIDSDGNTSYRHVPVEVSKLADALGCDQESIRGYFIFRGCKEVNDLSSKYTLPRIRFHQFFKYIEGLWGELIEPDHNNGRFIGKLSYQPTAYINTPEGDVHKVLELLRCECCGTLYIGGNRFTNGSNTAMLLNTPNLESIPNRTATPMVQNKKYSDYCIFYPVEDGGDNGVDRLTGVNYQIVDGNGIVRCSNNVHGEWEKCYLRPSDGTIHSRKLGSGYIPGYLYKITGGDHDKISALPCQCPHCDKNYAKRKYTKSPIRSFRTGIERSNQLLTKELMYQLNDVKMEKEQAMNPDKYFQTHGKLISFSDSRQDAAELSYGIAKEHFRDLVRYLFIDIINSIQQESEELTELKKDLVEDIDDGKATNKLERSIKGTDIHQDIKDRLIQIINDTNTDNATKKAAIVQVSDSADHIAINALIQNNNELDGELVKRLVRMGVNPAAVAYKDQYSDGFFWDYFYDMDGSYGLKPQIQRQGTTYNTADVHNKLLSYIYNNCFGQYMGLSVQDAGIGYITIKEPMSPTETQALQQLQIEIDRQNLGIDATEFINAYVRILGDQYRFIDPEFDYRRWDGYIVAGNGADTWQREFSSACKKGLKVLTDCPENEIALGNILYNVLRVLATDNGILLDSSKLQFKLLEENAPYYRCPKCGRIHLHTGLGICTNPSCCAKLDINQPSGKVIELRKNHFISYDILTEPREACRIHTEELTGQTDDQEKRLLEFKRVILDEVSERAKEIDMLNVTTTMEVGVDIGSLQAVFQGNMPPTRYNYQQRVGRGGRRGQAFSAAVTFCRGRSHDSYYYNSALEEITGGKPKDPTLAVNPPKGNNERPNLAIIQRVILKHVLMYAFIDFKKKHTDINFIVEGDTHGQFGEVSRWSSIRPILVEWIQNEKDKITTIVNDYLRQFDYGSYAEEIYEWYQTDLPRLIDNAVKNANANGLAQAMAESGLLPLYGMPSTMRSLYHGTGKEISRSLQQSITEFAPGSIKTKDAGHYRSAGLTINLSHYLKVNRDSIDIERPDLDPLEYKRWLSFENGNISDISRTQPDNPGEGVMLVIPKGFRTSIIEGNLGELSENTDNRSSYSQSEIFVKESSHSIDRSFANATCLMWNCDEQVKTEVWHINDNHRTNFRVVRGYRCRHINNGHGNGYDVTYDPNFFGNNHLVTQNDDVTNRLLELATSYMALRYRDEWDQSHDWKLVRSIDPSGEIRVAGANENLEEVDIALGANKVTEVLRLSVNKYNSSIDLDLRSGYVPGIKAAYYSAATIIQRYLADELDIEPDEIELSVQEKDGKLYIYLCDALDNGAGFIRMLCEEGTSGKPHLYEIMEDIVNPEPRSKFIKALYNHKDKCHTACHNCLMTYGNQGLHHILDWRLGIDLIKLMIDPDYKMGAANIHDTPYEDLDSLMESVSTELKNSGIGEVTKDGNHRIINPTGIDDSASYLIHPLWNEAYLPTKDGLSRAHNIFQLTRGLYTQTEEDNLNHIETTPDPITNIVEDTEDLG